MKQPIGQFDEQYDADAELGEVVMALREARWRLARASTGLFERYHDLLLDASKVES